MIHPLRPGPDLSTSLNQYYPWPVIHLVVFLFHFQPGIFHISQRPHKIQPSGWKEEQTNNMDLGQLQAQEREFCDTLHSPCICRLSRAYILRVTSTKVTRNANSSLTVFPHCLLLLTVLPLHCYLMPTGHFCSLLSTVSLRLPLSTVSVSSLVPSSPRRLPVSREISTFVLISRQNKEIVWPARTHTHPTQWSHSVTRVNVTFTQYPGQVASSVNLETPWRNVRSIESSLDRGCQILSWPCHKFSIYSNGFVHSKQITHIHTHIYTRAHSLSLSLSHTHTHIYVYVSWSPRGVVASVLECDIVVASSNSCLAVAFTFGLILSAKAWTFLFLWVCETSLQTVPYKVNLVKSGTRMQ